MKMILTLKELHVLAHDKLLALRSIDRFLHDERFVEKYPNLSDDEKRKINKAIDCADKKQIAAILMEQSNGVLKDMKIRELRILARNRNVLYYGHLTKSQLLEVLSDENPIKDDTG